MKDSKAQQDRKKFQGRKFTSICLAAALTFSLCPANVWATQGDPAVGTETIQDIEDSAPSTEEEFSQETEEGVPQEETEETVLPEETEKTASPEETQENSFPEEAEEEALPEEITVTGTKDQETSEEAGDSATEESSAPAEISVFGISDLDADENGVLRSADAGDWDTMIGQTVNWLKGEKGQILNDDFLSQVSSTNTDWTVFSLARLGIQDNFSGFLSAADSYVADKYAEDPEYGLSYNRATEWHRLALAVLAAGGDPTSVGGHNLIADGVYNCLIGEPWQQGINGAVWGLLALDSLGYEVPEGSTYDRESLIRYILDNQAPGGGWSLYGGQDGADADITGMTVYALAPYYAGNQEIRTAVDSGLSVLRAGISQDGDLQSSGDYNCESTAQAIAAFAAMGIDPASVTSSSGKSLLDGLAKYYNTSTGGFKHLAEDTESNGMATDQALYAIAAYRCWQQGSSVWDFKAQADTSAYAVQAGAMTYTCAAGSEAVLEIGSNVQEIQIQNLPIGNYDAAEITVGEDTYRTTGRKADGSTPVEGTIPVESGTVLNITVYRQNGSQENWTLTIQADGAAAVQAVISQIDRLPSVAELTLTHQAAVQAAQAAYDSLTEEEKVQVTNYGKLVELQARLQELEAEDEEARDQERQEFQEKIQGIETPVKISDKLMIHQYLTELEALGEWPQKAELKAALEGYLKQIEEREAVADALDQDIWNQIDPLRINQDSADTVNALMTRYSQLETEEQELLVNIQSLLNAAEIVQSLDDGVIPEAVFQNIRRTQESFVYRGKLADGTDYTLTYQGAEIQAAADIQAGVKISQGDVSVEGAALQVEFLQNGSMNGPVTLETTCSAADGTYDLYWLNPDKLTIQSAGTAQVASGKLKMTVSIGGRYWLAKEILGLNGNNNSGTPEGLTSNAQGELTILGNSDTEKSLAGTGSGYSIGTSRSASTGSARKVSTSSAASSSQNILKVETEGIMSKEELEEIKGTSRNLQGEGKLNDKISYTLTINGEDVERTEDFQFRIRTGEDCEHKEDIETLAQEPLILCMESMETFPGKMLVTLNTEMEDGTTLLFSYDPETREAGYVKKLTIEKGVIEFTLEEGGDYFIAERALSGSLNDIEVAEASVQTKAGDTDAADTWDESQEVAVLGVQDTSRPLVYVLPAAAAAAVLIAGLIIYRRKRRHR